MNHAVIDQDQEVITRYVRQPARLPAELRAQVEREWNGEPVQLYALADLDAGLKLSESWLLLGPTKMGSGDSGLPFDGTCPGTSEGHPWDVTRSI